MRRMPPLNLPTLRALAGVPAPEASFESLRGFGRREILRGGAALAAFALLSRTPVARASAWPAAADSPFTLGVASGDPDATSVVLWTRLAPDPLAGGGMGPTPVPVRWEVATDPAMNDVVRSGEEIASAEDAHSVHATVQGLVPDRWYWYRFIVNGVASPIGRTRTFPDPRVVAQRLRFALTSCQDWQAGLYTAWRDISEQDLDCVLHVGDYIYEGGISRQAIRQHNGGEIFTLEEYRNRHALYRSDPWLQRAHALFPFIVTWDDHEVDNNYANDVQEQNTPREAFLERRANGYRAYYEHMPLRREAKPVGPDMNLYRFFDFGRLARLSVLDTRQFRTDQPCGDLLRVPCAGVFDPSATMTGAEQERWLLRNLLLSRARWNVIAQQVMMMQMNYAAGISADQQLFIMDVWDGYFEARRRILEWIARYRIRNTIVLAGDIHSAWAGDLKPDFDRPESPIVGSEFVCTSVSSGFQTDLVGLVTLGIPGNPHIKYFNGLQRGYTLCDVTPQAWTSHFRVASTTSDVFAPVTTARSFVVQHGVPGLVPA